MRKKSFFPTIMLALLALCAQAQTKTVEMDSSEEVAPTTLVMDTCEDMNSDFAERKIMLTSTATTCISNFLTPIAHLENPNELQPVSCSGTSGSYFSIAPSGLIFTIPQNGNFTVSWVSAGTYPYSIRNDNNPQFTARFVVTETGPAGTFTHHTDVVIPYGLPCYGNPGYGTAFNLYYVKNLTAGTILSFSVEIIGTVNLYSVATCVGWYPPYPTWPEYEHVVLAPTTITILN